MRNAIAAVQTRLVVRWAALGRSAATEYVASTDVEDASGTAGPRRAARHVQSDLAVYHRPERVQIVGHLCLLSVRVANGARPL